MKFVYFRVADDNATAWPLSKLVDVRYNDATNLDLFFRGAIGQDSVDTVTLTIKSGTADDVMKSLGDLFYNHKGGPIIKVADSVDSVFVDSNITAVASITLAS